MECFLEGTDCILYGEKSVQSNIRSWFEPCRGLFFILWDANNDVFGLFNPYHAKYAYMHSEILAFF